jgi:hypothetical protein
VHLPDPHPDPPLDLHLRPLPIREMTSPWIRIHRRHYGPIYFGRTGDGRFDAPAGQYGILYVASDAHGAFIETLGHETGRTAIDWDEIEERALAEVAVSRPLRLVDLSGEGLAHIGADDRLTSGSYAVSQPWALKLHEHPDQPDGLFYRARHDPSCLCAAIFDRAEDALATTPLGSLADSSNAPLLASILDAYRLRLIHPGSL